MLEEEKNKLDECTQDRNIEASSENRNCKENSCCEKKYAPNIPMYHFEFTNTGAEEDASCEEKMDSRREMIKKIRCLDFAIVELAQYLDTHPEDKKALALHKEYANALMELKEKYQRVYGPLDIKFPCNKWRWIEEPWPWERGNF